MRVFRFFILLVFGIYNECLFGCECAASDPQKTPTGYENIYEESITSEIISCSSRAYIDVFFPALHKLKGDSLDEEIHKLKSSNQNLKAEVTARVKNSDFNEIGGYISNEMLFCLKSSSKLKDIDFNPISKCLKLVNFAYLAAKDFDAGKSENEMSYSIPSVTLDYSRKNSEGLAHWSVTAVLQMNLFKNCIEPGYDTMHTVYPEIKHP